MKSWIILQIADFNGQWAVAAQIAVPETDLSYKKSAVKVWPPVSRSLIPKRDWYVGTHNNKEQGKDFY